MLQSSHAPSGITIRVTGEIDGSATIYAGNWDKVTIAGKVDWMIYHDWFEPTCELHYEPNGVTSGAIQIDYTFR